MDYKQEYREKLKDPRWRKKRLDILERDNFTCKNCGGKESPLHVHHVDYIHGNDPWDYEDKWLLTLCETCHEFETKYRREAENELLKALKQKHFMTSHIYRLSYIIKDRFVPFRDMDECVEIIGQAFYDEDIQSLLTDIYENGHDRNNILSVAQIIKNWDMKER